jgi:hypothetical protein
LATSLTGACGAAAGSGVADAAGAFDTDADALGAEGVEDAGGTGEAGTPGEPQPKLQTTSTNEMDREREIEVEAIRIPAA